MRDIFSIILMVVALSAFGQGGRFPVHSATGGTPPALGAEVILLGEGDVTDEKGNVSFTSYGTPTFPTSPTPPEGTQQIELNGTKYLESNASVNTGYSQTWIFHIYAGSSSKTLVSNMVGNDGYRLSLDVNNDDIYFYTGNGTDTDNATALNVGIPSYDYYQVAVVTTSGTATIYFDGVDVTTDYTIRTDYETTGIFRIGSIMGTAGNYVYGNIDAVQWYKWDLTSTQIGNTITTPGQEQNQ